LKKIIIVEDDIATLELVEIIFQANSYAVIKANRQISIKEIAGIHPNLVLIDYLLPYKLGSELCWEIKNAEATKHIPVILYSASSNLQIFAKNSCADGYIEKPFDINDLVNMVDRIAL
jgi:DNA-binding response OmpR family regulator